MRHTAKILMPWAILALLVLFLSGCADQVLVPKEVDVPVAVICTAPAVTEPDWSLPKLTAPIGVFDGTKACFSDTPLHFSYEKELNAALAVCRDGP